MNEGWKNYIKERKKRFVFIALILIIGLFFLGTQLVLYVNFLLGNDLIVGLQTDNEFLTLQQGQSTKVNFNIDVKSNPTCMVICKGVFTDLALQKSGEEEIFNVVPGIIQVKKFTITSSSKIEGKDLYRYDISCHNVKSVLCHTSEQELMKSSVIIVEYQLNNEEKKVRDNLQLELQTKVQEMEIIEENVKVNREVVKKINDQGLLNEIDSINNKIEQEKKLLQNLQGLWKEQEFTQISRELEKDQLLEIKNSYLVIELSVNESLQWFNAANKEWKKMKELLDNSSVVLNNSMLEERKGLNSEFMMLVESPYNTTILNKTQELKLKVLIFKNSSDEELRREIVAKEIQLLVAAETLCNINKNCFEHKKIEDIADLNNFDLNNICDSVRTFRNNYAIINNSIKVGNQSLVVAEAQVQALVYDIGQKSLNKIEKENNNYELIVQNMPNGVKGIVGNYSELMIPSLGKFLPEKCGVIEQIEPINFSEQQVQLREKQNVSLNISFSEPKKMCCALNRCNDCCEDNSCREDSKFTPIIFVHGHAFNKEVSTEYSLNAFNVLQNKLEEEGYLNTGVLSGYLVANESGDWSEFNIPVTLKVSYYYDAYEQGGKYQIVQQKSEYIDTYTLRLKEIIDKVQARTGRPKVIIIAHSMGGLVARRYMQVFGDANVEKLIMIGTPNKGIVGDVSKYCDVLGEQRECEDMNMQSVFMKKLNSGKALKNVKMYTIIGKGCNMVVDGVTIDGDGIVPIEQVALSYAKNYYVSGKCDGLNLLHSELLDITRYPEVYKEIKKMLKE